MSVSQFYTGKNVLVTGATGFLGKCLVEKLVRTFPDVGRVYVMIRDHHKDGKYTDRCRALMQTSVFDRIRNENPNFSEKIIPVFGDLLLPEFSMKPDELAVLADNVHIVINAGTTAKFQEPIRVSVKNKVVAMKELCDICRQFQQIESLTHVSSAGVNVPNIECEERLYRVETSAILRAYADNDDDALADYERQRKGKDDTGAFVYTSNKNMGENVLAENAAGLPIVIVRPSIIHAALREPYPGWMDCNHGIAPILETVFTGARTSVFGNPSSHVDLIPVDFCVNLCLVAAWYRARHHRPPAGSSEPPIFNYSGTVNPIFQEKLYDYVQKCSSATRASKQPVTIYTSMEAYKWNTLTKPLMWSFGRRCWAALGGAEHSKVKEARYQYEYTRVFAPVLSGRDKFRMDNVDKLLALMSAADREVHVHEHLLLY